MKIKRTRSGRATLPGVLGDESVRSRIIRGAAAAFARRGVSDCTVQHILHEATISRRTFYQYFDDKEHVLDALFGVATDLLVQRVRAAVLSVADPVERLERGVEAYLELQQHGGPLVSVLHAEAIHPESRLASRREHTRNELAQLFAEHVQETQAHTVDPLVFHGLLLAMEGLMLHMCQHGAFDAVAAARLQRVIVPLMVRVVAAPGAKLPALPRPPSGTQRTKRA